MGNIGEIWYPAIQERKRTRKNPLTRIQEKNEKRIRSSSWRKEKKEGSWEKWRSRIQITPKRPNEGLWSKRKGEKTRLRK